MRKEIKIDMSEFEVEDSLIQDMKLTCLNWERKRKQSGLGKLTEKERIAQNEMAQASHSADIALLGRQINRLWAVVILLSVSLLFCGLSQILAR